VATGIVELEYTEIALQVGQYYIDS